MKLIVLVLSMFVLALTSLPCCVLAEQSHAHNGQQADSPDNCPEKKDDCCKDCSPFYVCGSCPGFIINDFSLLASILPLEHSSCYGSYLPFKLSEIIIPVWQPPKLG
ncbi:DUF6660 family protein [Anseongella ginsenosidimutans]|uniref:DUF6660 family protein n=1 Tax=Anseongella ginsenosidimutans TaxID=496056 RepID=UPI001053C9B0|nr:DUF6660 family protein [Anseongella ginsenosidimutans]QEC52565.1 hypothetical protein FRZ59_09605 [Anseongella ginsenosidimutans]